MNSQLTPCVRFKPGAGQLSNVNNYPSNPEYWVLFAPIIETSHPFRTARADPLAYGDNFMDNAIEANAESASTQRPYSLEKIRGYCVIELNEQYSNINWGELQDSTTRMINEVVELGVTRVMVDLTRLEQINSGLVAVLVRLWKALTPKTRRMSVITERDDHHQIFTIAGLHKLWTITDSREEGAYELGFSERSDRETRELRVLALGALPFAILAAITLLPLSGEGSTALQANAQLAGLLMGAMSLTAGVVSVFKDKGLRRLFSVAAIVVSLAVLSTIAFEQNPISFQTSVPPDQAGMDTE